MSIWLIVSYLAGATFTYGFSKGLLLNTFPDIETESYAVFIAIVWPIGLPAIAILNYCHIKSTKNWSIRFRK